MQRDFGPSPTGPDVVENPGVQLDDNGLEILERDECLRLLHTAAVGRVGLTSRALPTVLPVNYRFDGERILIRSGPGTKLSSAMHDSVVAFEIDDFDAAMESGWSVVVTGRATLVRDAGRDELPWITRWPPLGDGHVLSISIDIVAGRSIPVEGRHGASP